MLGMKSPLLRQAIAWTMLNNCALDPQKQTAMKQESENFKTMNDMYVKMSAILFSYQLRAL